MINYRLMSIEDYDEVYAIWVACHNGLNTTDDSKEGIAKYLKRNPSTSFVATENGHVVGVILCGHDGRRGFIQHMSISPSARRKGIGSKLVELALDALRKEDIKKVALVAFKTNDLGNAFWEAQGFTLREDLNYRNRALEDLTLVDTYHQ